MNTKTTLLLAFSLVAMVLLYYVVQSRPGAAEGDTLPAPAFASSSTTRDLFEKKLGDITKVVCRRKDGEEWVFEKDTETSDIGQPVWRMTSPLEMKCVRWEVEKFGNRLGNVKYELSYAPGEAGAITAADAGLDPPEAVVTLTDADGKTVTVEIGKPASNRETYVRLAGSYEICVGQTNLKGLIKDKALEYREKQLWNFKSESVTRVEIIDRSEAEAPLSYTFARDGARWMMESPVTARATSKVDDMVSAMSRLRAVQWSDDRPDTLGMYGFKPPALTVRATVEEEVPIPEPPASASAISQTPEPPASAGAISQLQDPEEADAEEDADDEPADPKTELRITVFELHLSDQSPIGQETKTFMRIADENAVATVMKSTADKFRPVMSEWREMRITMADTSAATRIELTTPEGSATLVKNDGAWSFESDGGRAEESAVSDILKAVGDLTAVVYVDEKSTAAFGLDQPQAEIRLTIPGVEGVERIVVGGYTDEKTKRLVYVRRNELASIGKVRRADVAKLLQGPRVYRDRTVVDVLPSRFERITLSTENRFVGGKDEVTLERSDNTWNMTGPVAADVREDEMDKLVEALAGLRAEQVIAESGEASAYGLHAPEVTIVLTYKPPVEYRIETPTAEPSGPPQPPLPKGGDVGVEDDNDKVEAAVPVEVQPPSQTVELSVTQHDGKYYAKRSDRGTVYEVTGEFYKQLLAEYRIDRIIEFDEARVRRFSIRKGDETHVFEKRDDRWIYQAEPDLPLDAKKVDNLLLQVRDLRTNRYVRHVVDDLSTYGLSAPLREVTVTLDDGAVHVLWISDKTGGKGTDRGFYATVRDGSGVFLLTADSARRFEVSLDELEKLP